MGAVEWVSPASLPFDDNCYCAISHLLGLRQSNITQYSINPASMTIAFAAKRQTLLFSATQTRNVEDLARVSLKKEPLYIGVDDNKVRECCPSCCGEYLNIPQLLFCVFLHLLCWHTIILWA